MTQYKVGTSEIYEL